MKTNITNKITAYASKNCAVQLRGGKTQRHCINRHGGFTLIEMLTAVGIISVLVSVSIPIINSSLKKAQEATVAE